MTVEPDAVVYLVRHGRTELNAGGRLRGRRDVPLDTVGLTQAARLGRWLEPVDLAVVVSSPLCRAVATAAPIARTGAISPKGAQRRAPSPLATLAAGRPGARVRTMFG